MLTLVVMDVIDAAYEDNDELTAPKLRKIVQQRTGMLFSESSLKVARRRLGWVATNAKYCQLIREANRVKRLDHCRQLLASEETFQDVIFTDETSVELDRHARITFRRKWEAPHLKGRPKHPLKVHVWGGISKRGATEVIVFKGIMKAEFYCDAILEGTLLPFIRKAYPDHHSFMQDNDPNNQ